MFIVLTYDFESTLKWYESTKHMVTMEEKSSPWGRVSYRHYHVSLKKELSLFRLKKLKMLLKEVLEQERGKRGLLQNGFPLEEVTKEWGGWFYPTRFAVIGAKKALASLLKQKAIENDLLVIKESGGLQLEEASLLEFCGLFQTVGVVTKRREVMREMAENLLEAYGIPVIVTENMELCKRADFILMSHDGQEHIIDAVRCPVYLIGAQQQTQQKEVVITEITFSLSKDGVASIPIGIEPYNFFGILYEEYGILEVANEKFSSFVINGEKKGISFFQNLLKT